VVLGACLPDPQERLENRMKRADALLKAGIRAGLLTRVSADSYAFVVPEIGYLLAALAVYGSRPPETMPAQARAYLAQNPTELSAALLMDFSHWYSQSGLTFGQLEPPRRIRL
jgi:hypothetical protein